MKKQIITIVLSLIFLFTENVDAQVVKVQDAKKVAINFYYERVNQFENVPHSDINVRSSKINKEHGLTMYYTFFMKPGGFVIVSANERIKPVLAYSFTGNNEKSATPPAFTERMKMYSIQIKHILENVIEADTRIQQEWKHLISGDINELKSCKSKAVQPLLTCTWNQGIYYNGKCPVDPAGPDDRCYAGCVATCIGQIMYYYRWPETGVGSYTYIHPVYGTISADFANTTYKWDEMADDINTNNDALAELLFHIGVSVDMNYGPNGSGMYNHKAGYIYRTYFKYVPETHYIFRDSTTIDWDSVLTHHLDRKMPLYYAGWTADSLVNISGHAFVCDGYQDTNYFHFNWGWSGSYDAFFYLNDLTPGGSSFNYGHEVVANIYPDTNNYTYPSYCTGLTTLTSTLGTFEDGSGPIDDYMDNADCMWLIAPQDPNFDSITKIKLWFTKFDTESNADSVIIYDGSTTNDAILGSFSGNNIPPTVYSTGDEILVRFISNGSNGANGWLASYESVFPVYCSSQVLTSYHDTISDGSGNKRYNNNTLCNWFINTPNINDLTLYFTEFDTENTYDHLSIYDPSTTPSTLLARYSGNNIPPPVTSPSGKMFLTFFTNAAINGQGWKAYYDTLQTTGIEQNIVLEDLNIYPTPCTDVLNINYFADLKGKINISLTDIHGSLLNERVYFVNPGYNKHIIITSDISPGVYSLRIKTTDGVVNRKVIIQ